MQFIGQLYDLVLRRRGERMSVVCATSGDTGGAAAAAFAGASFMQRRYGLRVGIPAYGAAAFVAWSRVDADRHHVRDVVAAAGLAVLSSYTLARPLPNNITVLPTADDGVFGLMFSGSW